ncbi:hypothetical protein E4U48_002155 [Claviceps purpurea]|nr:hypothetical protein E4U48_002155 [Claviceps purpurea]
MEARRSALVKNALEVYGRECCSNIQPIIHGRSEGQDAEEDQGLGGPCPGLSVTLGATPSYATCSCMRHLYQLPVPSSGHLTPNFIAQHLSCVHPEFLIHLPSAFVLLSRAPSTRLRRSESMTGLPQP